MLDAPSMGDQMSHFTPYCKEQILEKLDFFKSYLTNSHTHTGFNLGLA